MWRASLLLWLSAMAAFTVSTARAQGPGDDAESFFEIKIRPILAGKCFTCHGGKKTSGGLRVDSRDALIKGGDDGPAVVPGDPRSSLIVQAVGYTHESIRMPPDRRLSKDVAEDFATWIRAGALWPVETAGAKGSFVARAHWAFEPVAVVDPPRDPDHWSDHPIDRFVAAKRKANGVAPVGLADWRSLLRRVTFDLIGLPPSPQEIANFLSDESPTAYERVVERLLSSPRYGERWGRYWMDVARYADTAGDNADYPIPEAALYRDYIIDSFNADKPYDEFVQEQIAGDLLAAQGDRRTYPAKVIATGFLALSRRYATAPEELWHLTLEDTIETTGRAFLGLTLRCARCHDHKFDPVTRDDYYALYGIFASTKFPYAGSEEFQSKGFPRAHFAPLLPPGEADPKWKLHQQRIQALEREIQEIRDKDPLAAQIAEYERQLSTLTRAVQALEAIRERPSAFKDQIARIGRRRDEARSRLDAKLRPRQDAIRLSQRPGLPHDLPGAYAVQEGTPVDEAVHLRGEPAARGPVVRRNVPKFLAGANPPKMPETSSGRLELARWLTRSDHPLTARVMVNRIWQHHFGRGIVGTPSNFGLRGDEPTHPELLDWLAAQFVASGWSVKSMHRLILTSKTYQLASTSSTENASLDPDNRAYWRYSRRRLDAESIRDSMLLVAGNLDGQRPGRHPFPPIAQWAWTQHTPFKAVYASNHRSVYLMTQRLQRHPFLALFDGPDTNHSTDQRTSATVPLQALYLMNNPFVLEQAKSFARRLISYSPVDQLRIEQGYLLAWGRPPTPDEAEACIGYTRRFRAELALIPRESASAENAPWISLCRILLTANEFLYLD